MNTLLVPIHVLVDGEKDRHPETTHTSLFKQENIMLPPNKPAAQAAGADMMQIH